MTDLSTLTDKQLDDALGNVAADWALAEKYEHNAHLRPAIRRHFDALHDEQKRRAKLSERRSANPTEEKA